MASGSRITVLILTLLALAASPASAKKTHLFQETFGSAAQPSFQRANGLAVDQSTGDVLVIDADAMTVSRYHADGTPSNFSALGSNVIDGKGTGDQTPQGGFAFNSSAGEQQITVDNSGTVTDGNIYVTQGLKEAGNLVDIFASSGEYLGQLTADKNGIPFGTVGTFPFSPVGVTLDDSGNVYITGGYDRRIYKFDPAANPPVNADNTATFITDEPVGSIAAGVGSSSGSIFVTTFYTFKENSLLELDSASGAVKGVVDPIENQMVSVDPSTGHLYVYGGVITGSGNVGDHRLSEYDVSGSSASLVSTFTPNAASQTGIAVDGSSGRIYLSNNGDIHVYSPLVTVPDVTTGGATITGDTSVTLDGTVNPDGGPIEECRFEYGPTAAYGQSVSCTETPAEIGTTEKAVHAELTGLDKEATYHYRLVAKNANATIPGNDKVLKTPSKPGLNGVWAQEVGFAEARLKAEVNPENSPTTYRFEWGLDSSYGQSTADIPIGTDDTDQTVGHGLTGLQPGATYHYRLVATNGIGTSASPDQTFTTFPLPTDAPDSCPNAAFRTGASARLPDCRAFEMVSPLEKGNTDIQVRVNVFNYPARIDQGAADGSSFSFSSEKSFGGALSAPWTSQYLARRQAGVGWSTEPINPPIGTPLRVISGPLAALANATLDVEYKAFDPTLGSSWLLHSATPTLDPCAAEGFSNLYRRDNADGTYEALTIAPPANQAPGLYWPALQGVSDDGQVAVFVADAKLTDDASGVLNGSGEPIYQLYKHVADPSGEGCGELRLVSVLPSGKASAVASSAGTPASDVAKRGEGRENTVADAVSSDGSRVYWTASAREPGPLYLSADGEKTVQLSSEAAQFWTAATDGSKAIYEVKEELFEYDAESKAKTLIAAGSKGVAGASEDLSRLYFVSTEALGGEGEAGEPNLYLRQREGSATTTRLVATLAERDARGANVRDPLSVVKPLPTARGVRVTADGEHIVFISEAPLTGYDNKDAASGVPSVELYRYAAADEELSCISCNPSGGRPQTRRFGSPENRQYAAALLPAWENETFAPRVLSEDGSRLFFNSFDALLPRDTNGAQDVYEWEEASGQAECDAMGAELYVPEAGGCLSLISTGQSPVDSEVIDATPSGSDVFIKTSSSLLPQDPGLIDIYDAREGGGLPPPPSPPPGCEGEACQGPPAPPNDPTPSSSTFDGAGNLKEAGPTKPRCTKPRVRRNGRCVKPRKAAAKRAKHRATKHDRAQGR